MSTDRLQEITERFSTGWSSSVRRMADIAWLINEVETLRRERGRFIADAATAVEQIRATGAENG